MSMHLIVSAAAQLLGFVSTSEPYVTPQVAIGRIAECGAGAVSLRPDAERDVDVLVIAATAAPSDRQLACIADAARGYDVELPPAMQARFDVISEARSNAMLRASARRWLQTHGLLNALPAYRPGKATDIRFARQIEKLCHADGALGSRYGPHALAPEWIMPRPVERAGEDRAMMCLLYAAQASGFRLDLVGNESAEAD